MVAVGISWQSVLQKSGRESHGTWKRHLEAKTPGLCQIYVDGEDGPLHECGKPGRLMWCFAADKHATDSGGTQQYLCPEHEERMSKIYRVTPVSPAIGETQESGESTQPVAA